MRKYVIIGVPGSGKSTQAGWLARDLDLVHISVGDIFRWNVQNHTKMGAQVRRIMVAGELVGDDLAEAVTAQRLADHDWNYGFIVDGFPRNARQAEFFLESYDIDAVIHLHMPDSEVRKRVLARRLCSGCGLDYNLIQGRPREEGKCDVCGGTLVTREDDTPEALAVRLHDFHDKTDPVLAIFARKEYVLTIDATQDQDGVQQAIRDALGLPAPSPAENSSGSPAVAANSAGPVSSASTAQP
jgi:adenylate kinase